MAYLPSDYKTENTNRGIGEPAIEPRKTLKTESESMLISLSSFLQFSVSLFLHVSDFPLHRVPVSLFHRFIFSNSSNNIHRFGFYSFQALYVYVIHKIGYTFFCGEIVLHHPLGFVFHGDNER